MESFGSSLLLFSNGAKILVGGVYVCISLLLIIVLRAWFLFDLCEFSIKVGMLNNWWVPR